MKWRNLLTICLISSIFIPALALQPRRPCRLRESKYGYVCVCDENYCDDLNIPLPKKNREFTLVTSSESGERFSYEKGDLYKQSSAPSNASESDTRLEIDSTKVYQKIWGFGGGHPGATTYLLDKLSPNLRKCFYNSFYSRYFGMNYVFIRLPIGGCDFDTEPWAYNEYPENDVNLSNFTQLDDRELKRNQQLKEMAQISKNSNIKLLAAAWSPPRWMKANHKWIGLMNNAIKEEYYQTWADYHVKWLELMKNEGLDVWALSTGNEPVVGGTNFLFEETYWNPVEQAKWITGHLVPAIKKSQCSNIEIHGLDDSRINAPFLKKMIASNNKSLDDISALSIHGYSDLLTSPETLDEIQKEFHKPIYYSEMTFGLTAASLPGLGGPRLGLWPRTEALIDTLMNNFNHSIVSYIDWNLVLNSTGGPNYAGPIAQADAPIILSADYSEMYKQPTFYAMAHFSKFIPPGSIRIYAKLKSNGTSGIKALAFLRPDSKISVVLYNSNKKDVNLTVEDRFKGPIEVQLKAKSINTLIYTVGSREDPPSTKRSNPINIFIMQKMF